MEELQVKQIFAEKLDEIIWLIMALEGWRLVQRVVCVFNFCDGNSTGHKPSAGLISAEFVVPTYY